MLAFATFIFYVVKRRYAFRERFVFFRPFQVVVLPVMCIFERGTLHVPIVLPYSVFHVYVPKLFIFKYFCQFIVFIQAVVNGLVVFRDNFFNVFASYRFVPFVIVNGTIFVAIMYRRSGAQLATSAFFQYFQIEIDVDVGDVAGGFRVVLTQCICGNIVGTASCVATVATRDGRSANVMSSNFRCFLISDPLDVSFFMFKGFISRLSQYQLVFQCKDSVKEMIFFFLLCNSDGIRYALFLFTIYDLWYSEVLSQVRYCGFRLFLEESGKVSCTPLRFMNFFSYRGEDSKRCFTTKSLGSSNEGFGGSLTVVKKCFSEVNCFSEEVKNF